MQLITKKYSSRYVLFLAVLFSVSCEKQETLTPQPVPETKIYSISFNQDTIPVTLSITSARKENIGNSLVTAIDGKLPDSISSLNKLIIRVTGDSARLYNNTEILASFTDSLGNTFANDVSDTLNKVTITKMQKVKDGHVEGSFTIRVSNFTKTKFLFLNSGKFSTAFQE